jgi:U2 small nuclear ribonucleoprotein A'
MRLTLDLLLQAPQSLNPANQRQLLLRGFKIPSIENLGGTNDAYECIDLSDNDLIKLGNFPPMKRLHALLLMNNRISRIAEDAFDPLPHLTSVILTGNKLEKLVDLEPLTRLKSLERLSLLENPVTKVKHYRPYMISKCSKTLRILDFNRVKDKERKAAALLFAGERGKKLLEEIAPPRAPGKEIGEKAAPGEVAKVTGPTPEVIERIKKAIAEAETIEEVTRLERALKSGILPDDLKLDKTEEPEKPAEKDDEMKPAAEEPAAKEKEAKDAEMKVDG